MTSKTTVWFFFFTLSTFEYNDFRKKPDTQHDGKGKLLYFQSWNFSFEDLLITPNSSETLFIIRYNFYFKRHKICIRKIQLLHYNFPVNSGLTSGSLCKSSNLHSEEGCWGQGQTQLENNLHYLCKVRCLRFFFFSI